MQTSIRWMENQTHACVQVTTNLADSLQGSAKTEHEAVEIGPGAVGLEPGAAALVAETFPNVAPYKDLLETIQQPQETDVAEAVLRIPDGAYHSYMLLSDVERGSLIGS